MRTLSEVHAGPLVSVIVLTYNSATTVLETLDSILGQSYHPIEVVISDDASTDETVRLAEDWARANASHFERVEVRRQPANSGVCRNVAAAYAAARGAWLKAIAGDDLLMPGAIARFVEHAQATMPDVLISQVRKFECSAGVHRFGDVLPTEKHRADLRLNGGEALERWSVENPIPAPGVMLKRGVLEAVGGIDLDFVHLDDWPLWIKLQTHGLRFEFIDEPLVGYRVSESSVSTKRLAVTISPQYLRDLARFYRKYQRHRLPALERLDRSIQIFRWELAAGILRTHPVLYKATRALLLASPLRWIAPLRH